MVEEPLRAIHTPPPWTPSRGGDADAATAEARVINANAAARVEPRREGYYNAIQVFPYSEGALYQIYAAPGQITNIALEPGEQLTGAGPIAAGDTTRWIIGDTESGNGRTARVHILVKPTRPDIFTNLVINTDRRTYLLELRANETSYMPSVAWSYPPGRAQPRPPAIQQPVDPSGQPPQLSLWAASRREHPALAAGQRVRRRPPRLCRLSTRDRAGRDAAPLRAWGRWERGTGEHPRIPQRPDRGPALCRR